MASVNPIDLTSTYSDDSYLWEIQNYRDSYPLRDTATSIGDGIPQSQATSFRSNSTGHNAFSSEDPLSSKGVVLYEPPSKNLPSWADSPRPRSTGHNGPSLKNPSYSKRRTIHDEIPSRLQKRLNISETAGASSSRIDNNIYPMNRVLPPGFRSSTSNPARTNSSNGSRVLPPTMMPSKHSSSTPLVGLNDSFYQTGVGEERLVAPDADERLVFQAAVQKIALDWMLHKESSDLCRAESWLMTRDIDCLSSQREPTMGSRSGGESC